MPMLSSLNIFLERTYYVTSIDMIQKNFISIRMTFLPPMRIYSLSSAELPSQTNIEKKTTFFRAESEYFNTLK